MIKTNPPNCFQTINKTTSLWYSFCFMALSSFLRISIIEPSPPGAPSMKYVVPGIASMSESIHFSGSNDSSRLREDRLRKVWRAWLQQPLAQGEGDRFNSAVNVKLGENVVDVISYRAVADFQRLSDLIG